MYRMRYISISIESKSGLWTYNTIATGRGTSPATNERLENTSLVTNHMAKKLIAALLEEHRRRAM